MSFPVIIQMYASENGITTLAMMLAYHKKYVSLNELREHCNISRNGTSIKDLCSASSYFSLNTNVLNISADEALNQKFPFVVSWNKRNYAIVIKRNGNFLHMVDAYKGNYKIKIDKFYASYGGNTILFSPSSSFQKTGTKISFISFISHYAKKFYLYLIFTIIFTSIVTFSNSFLVHIQKNILDNIISNKTLKEALYLIYAYIGLIFLVLIINCIKTNAIYTLNRKRSKNSIKNLLYKIVNLPLPFFEKSYNCELTERIDTTINIGNLVFNSLIPRIINCFTTLIYLYLMLRYNIVIAIICFLVEIMHSIIIIRLQDIINIIQRSTTVSAVNSNSVLLNGLDMLKTIVSSGSERQYFSLWYKYQREYEKNYRKGEIFSSELKLISSLHTIFTSAIVLFVGSYFIIKGNITLSILSAFQVLYNNMHSSVTSILNINEYVEKIKYNLERIDDIKNEKEAIKIPLKSNEDKNKKLKGNIKVENLCYGYNSADKPAIENISFEAKDGEMIAIVGPSGCGKSTLLKNLSGTYQAKEGLILYDGKKREEIPDIIFHNSIATIDQNPIIFDGSLKDNIKLFNNKISDQDMIESTKTADIYERIMLEDEKFNTVISSNERKFSGGEIQRLELARALAIKPNILLLDEFTSALDTITEKKIFNAIRKLNKTCIISAHRFSTVIQCDTIIVMNHGKIVSQGTHDELYKKNELYKMLIDSK